MLDGAWRVRFPPPAVAQMGRMQGIFKGDNTGEVKYATAIALIWAIKHDIIDANPVAGFAGTAIIMVLMAVHVRNPHSKPATRVYMWLLYIIAGSWWLLKGNGLIWLGSLLIQ